MNIAGHDLTKRVFVVAEIGINHNGDPDIAFRLQSEAKNAGADAVKYQVGHPRLYVNRKAWYKPRQLEGGKVVPYIKYRERMELADDVLAELKGHAESLGLVWFASPLDVPAVDRLARLDVAAYKVASPMVTNAPLLQRIARETKPTLCSTGMSTLAEIDHAVTALGWNRVALLHCTSEYPCPPAHCNLRMISTLQERFPGRPVGYSGHEIGIPESIAAVSLGARIIERHLTLSRAMWGSDHAASLEPEALRRLVGYIRTVEEALGDGEKITYDGETVNAAKFRVA